MNPIAPRPAIICLTAISIALFFAISESPAEENRTISIEEAKAELARAKAAAEATSAPEPPRWRLFSRSQNPAPAETKNEAEELAREKQAEQTERKSRFRLFGRDKVANNDQPAEELPVEKPAQTPDSAALMPLREQPAESTGRKRLLGGLFRKNTQAAQTDANQTEPDDKWASQDPLNPGPAREKKPGSSLFGIFRKNDSKEFAQAEKTKLGKSVENEAAAPATGPLAKMSSKTGELGWYVVTDAKVPFYAVGPGQPLPPERLLDRGSMLTVTKGGWGWSNVKLGTGELGVVSTQAMRPATVAEVSRHTQPFATAGKSRGSRSFFNILSRGRAPAPELPTNSGSGPIRNFGLLPPVDPAE